MKLLKRWPFSIVILGAYPVLYAYSTNLGSVNPYVIIAPIMASISAAILLSLVCAIGTRSWTKGALIANFILLSIYLSTSVLEIIFPWLFTSSFSQPVAGLIIALILACAWAIGRQIRRKNDLSLWIAATNICCLLAITFPILQISYFHLTVTPELISAGRQAEGGHYSHARPSVYYIILDGYARDDVLKKDLGYDNSAFVNYLRRLGFFVAHHSRSNYAYTYLSLASSLSMNYITELNMDPDQERECIRRIRANNAARLFHANGYRTLTYSPNWLLEGQDRYSDTTFNPRAVNLKISY
jgi:hypothetical protein